MRSSSLLATIATALALLTGACTVGETSETTTEDTSFAVTTVETTLPTFDMANFSMDQVITGPSLTWSEMFSMEPHRPLGLVRRGDEWFLFTSPDMSREGLTAWSSIDGRSWQQIGVVVPAGPDVGAIEVGESGVQIWTAPLP